MTERAGRNDPCPCGSGLKYKKCCLPVDREKEGTEATTETVEQIEEPYEDFEIYRGEQEGREEQEVEPQMEYEDISDDEAVQLYVKEFAKCGYNIKLEVISTFFHRCLQIDGLVDSQRVEELCKYLRKHEKVVITSEDVNNFFDEL